MKSWDHWKKQDLWSEREFAVICCGLDPDGGFTDDESIAINKAGVCIHRAILARTLSFVSRSDVDIASRMYGTARHFRPRDVAGWARSMFETFPGELMELTSEDNISPKEKETLLEIIAALAEVAGADLREGAGHYPAADAIIPELKARGIRTTRETIANKLKVARQLIAPKGPGKVNRFD